MFINIFKTMIFAKPEPITSTKCFTYLVSKWKPMCHAQCSLMGPDINWTFTESSIPPVISKIVVSNIPSGTTIRYTHQENSTTTWCLKGYRYKNILMMIYFVPSLKTRRGPLLTERVLMAFYLLHLSLVLQSRM
jgi:hypothetical protein